jgi:hypothetical protein
VPSNLAGLLLLVALGGIRSAVMGTVSNVMRIFFSNVPMYEATLFLAHRSAGILFLKR